MGTKEPPSSSGLKNSRARNQLAEGGWKIYL
jgi:hypothetical protein